MPLQGGVELGIAMKRAMEEGGKPFQDLSAGAIAAALRRFEVLRSHRVAHIINKSQFMALFFWATGFLVRGLGGYTNSAYISEVCLRWWCDMACL